MVQQIDEDDMRIKRYGRLPDLVRHSMRFQAGDNAHFYIWKSDIRQYLDCHNLYMPMMLPLGPNNDCLFIPLTVL